MKFVVARSRSRESEHVALVDKFSGLQLAPGRRLHVDTKLERALAGPKMCTLFKIHVSFLKCLKFPCHALLILTNKLY